MLRFPLGMYSKSSKVVALHLLAALNCFLQARTRNEPCIQYLYNDFISPIFRYWF